MDRHSIVIPVYNEVDGIESLYERMCAVTQKISGQVEVILVNDGSKDGSAEKLDLLHQKDPRFKVIHFSRNFGHQAAVMAGIHYASGDTVSLIDADLQDPPELILEFIQKWQEGYQVIYGVRRKRKGETAFKLFTAWAFYKLLRSMTRFEIPVNTGDFRLMDRKAVNALLSLKERNPYIRGLVAWVGFKQLGIEYDRDSRQFGSTHYPFSKMLKFAWDGVTSFSNLPLKFATYLGVFTSIVSALAMFYTLYLRFFTDKTVQGWTSLIVAILFFSGVQLLCLGIIGEYLGRMFDDVRKRPLYIVKEASGFSPLAQGPATTDRAA